MSDNGDQSSYNNTKEMFKDYYALISDHGNALKHYRAALKCGKEQMAEDLRRTLYVIEKKIAILQDAYKEIEIKNALEPHLKEWEASNQEDSVSVGEPSSPESGESNIASEDNVANEEHSSPSSVVSNGDIDNTKSEPSESGTPVPNNEKTKKENFLEYYGLIHVDRLEELQKKHKAVRKCRANANPQYSREALEEKRRLAEKAKSYSKYLKEVKENNRKARAKNLVFNHGLVSKKLNIKFDDKPINESFIKIRTLQLNTFSCFSCRKALNKRDRRVVVSCINCKTCYHQKCLTSNPDNPVDMKCGICHDIMQSQINHEGLIHKDESFRDLFALSQNILQRHNFKMTLIRSNFHLKRELEDSSLPVAKRNGSIHRTKAKNL